MTVNKLNFDIFSTAPTAVKFGQSKSLGHNPTSGGSTAGYGLFSGKTVGTNEKIKKGDTIFLVAQAGKDAGIGHSQWIA